MVGNPIGPAAMGNRMEWRPARPADQPGLYDQDFRGDDGEGTVMPTAHERKSR